MNAIVFGAAGQSGYYLTELLKTKGISVTGISRSAGYEHADLGNYYDISSLFRSIRPDYVFHLAANSTTKHEAWKENHDTISTGSVNILEAVRETVPSARVFLAGSGLQFMNSGNPISESDPFEATSPYAVSRIHSTYAARYYRKLGIQVYVGYLFNHDSPRRSERHVAKMISEAVKRIGMGSTESLQIGAPLVEKEWGFAKDIVEGIWTLVGQDQLFEATIGTGKAYSIEHWADLCFQFIGRDYRKHLVSVEGFRPDFSRLVSDPASMRTLGWEAETSIEELVKIMMTS